jgi:DNA-binding NarL/FixJ family response regulator
MESSFSHPVVRRADAGAPLTPGVDLRRRPLELIPQPHWSAFVRELRLSDREAEVLRSIFDDERVASIAERMRLSRFTVDTYRERLFRKLHVSSTTQLVVTVFAAYLQYSSMLRGAAEDG